MVNFNKIHLHDFCTVLHQFSVWVIKVDQLVERLQFLMVQLLNNHDVCNTQIKIACTHEKGKFFRRPCHVCHKKASSVPVLIPSPKFSYYYIFKIHSMNKRIQQVPSLVCFKNLLANSLNHSLFFMWLYCYWMFGHCCCFSFFRRCALDFVLVTLEIFLKK